MQGGVRGESWEGRRKGSVDQTFPGFRDNGARAAPSPGLGAEGAQVGSPEPQTQQPRGQDLQACPTSALNSIFRTGRSSPV